MAVGPLAAAARRFSLGLFATSCLALPAAAGGIAGPEAGARALGFAGAYAAPADDASAVFHNAAGLAFLRGRQLYAGGALRYAHSDFTGAEPFPGRAVSERSEAPLVFPPAAFYAHRFSERLVLGIGLHMPHGFSSGWQNAETSFSGRFVATRASLRSYSLNPAVGYKLADRLAVGVGLDARFTRVELERQVPLLNPFTLRVVDAARGRAASNRALGFGFDVGILARPFEDLSVGAAYRHKLKADLDAGATYTLLPTGNAQLDALIAQRFPADPLETSRSLELPARASLAASYVWNDWLIAGQLELERWSSFDQAELARLLPRLDSSGRPAPDSPRSERYQGARAYRIGLERRLDDRYSVRGGYFYAGTAVPADALSPLLPDADRHGIAVGGTLRIGALRLDAANWLVLSKARTTSGRTGDRYEGTYKNFADHFAVSLGVEF
jgi:long-chain fatty acid transport protein